MKTSVSTTFLASSVSASCHSVRLIAVALILFLFSHASAYGQTDGSENDVGVVEQTSPTPSKVPTVDQLKARQKAIADDTELAEDARTAAVESLQKAIEHVTAATAFEQTTKQLEAELAALPEQLRQVEAVLQQPMKPPNFEDVAIPTQMSELQTAAKQAEAALTAATADRDAVQREIDRRSERRPKLSELLATNAQQLAEARTQLAAQPIPQTAEISADPVAAAKQQQLAARVHRLAAENRLLEQETSTYEATAKHWALKRDLTERKISHARVSREFWQKTLAGAKRKEADREAANAKAAAETTLASLKVLAEENATLAADNATLIKDTADVQQKLLRLQKRSDDRRAAFESLKKRAEAASFSPAIGVLLRVQQSTLPRTDNYRARAEERQQEITTVNVNIVEWETERRTLTDTAAEVETRLRRMSVAERKQKGVEEQLTELINARRNVLAELVQHAKTHLDELVKFDGLEKRFLIQLANERAWLAEHVLWVRSAEVLGSQLKAFVPATRTLLSSDQWSRAWEMWVNGVRAERWFLLASLIPFLLLLFARPTFKRQLHACGTVAARSNCVSFAPTLRAIGLTLLISVSVPTFVMFVGWKSADFGQDSAPLIAFGKALQLVGGVWLLIEFLRQVVASNGLGQCHLGWTSDVLKSVRSICRTLLLTQLAPMLLSGYTEYLGDELLISTWGRIAFIAAMVGACFAMWRMLKPSGAILKAICGSHDGKSLLRTTRWVWTSTAISAPVILAFISFLGFHYTAVRLTGRVAATLCLGIAALLVAAVLTRWLLVVYRRLAIQRARERRRRMVTQQDVEPDQPMPVQQEPEVQLNDINQQTRRLIRIGCSVVSLAVLYLIWVDVLPALGVFDDFQLWHDNLAVVNEGEDQPWVTAGDVLVFLIVSVLTLIAAGNIPGLMEISVLQRLPMDAGARYAASMISRYAITVVGFLMAFQWIGIGWGSVQWLVAAMTVGLGFGLQEIFANFVSGIILLFERPVRVGDTVTISEITGTVSRIQIRATTLLDWDNRELIVPNREFVTGHLVNWTLSNPTLRLVCTVGVAYGSDTRLATKLLYKVASEQTEILDTPEPTVVFTEFGDSSLTFELRVYVIGLVNFRRLRHEINLAIDDEFREHNIEIAFPQRDLHVRSLPAEMTDAIRGIRSDS